MIAIGGRRYGNSLFVNELFNASGRCFMPLVGARHTCVQDPVCVTCWELHDQQRELQNTWAHSFCVDIIFKLRGTCSLPRSLKSSRCTTKMPFCCTHLPSVEVIPCHGQSWRISFFFQPFLQLSGAYIYIWVCVYICIYCVSVHIKYFAQKHKACQLDVDIPSKNDHFYACVCVVCFTSKIFPEFNRCVNQKKKKGNATNEMHSG